MRSHTCLAAIILSLTFAGCSYPTEGTSGCQNWDGCGGSSYPFPPFGHVGGAVWDTASNRIQGVQVSLHNTLLDSLVVEETDSLGTFSVWADDCIEGDWENAVYFELGEIKRRIEIDGAFCKAHKINIPDWPTG